MYFIASGDIDSLFIVLLPGTVTDPFSIKLHFFLKVPLSFQPLQ